MLQLDAAGDGKFIPPKSDMFNRAQFYEVGVVTVSRRPKLPSQHPRHWLVYGLDSLTVL